MPIIKKDSPIKERPIIMLLYGVPSSGKTSVACTANNPILIDTDRGYDRAVKRADTLEVNSWEDVIAEEATLKTYNTIIVDTAKAMLDDFLWQYTEKVDKSLVRNKLRHFGAVGDEFKNFIAKLRSTGADLIFICHDKQGDTNDVITHEPDCTGSSKNLLNRMADQEGYVYINENNKRAIRFGATQGLTLKDTAGLGDVVIPDVSDPDYDTFMADLIDKTKKAIVAHSALQEEYLKAIDQLHKVVSVDDANAILTLVKSLRKDLQGPYWTLAEKTLSERGYIFDTKSKKFKANA